ncbi:MAG: fibronectin type III domain-containing protein [Eubacteriales bacterium]|nr:fibronectin type III domain-containing protein [Eubacteriales bacterium]
MKKITSLILSMIILLTATININVIAFAASKLPTTSITKISGENESISVVWKKSSKVTGYELQYSTDKNFNKKSIKKTKIKEKNTVSKTIKNLKANKKYYVRVRTYKTGKKKTNYSAWSKVKSVTVEKIKYGTVSGNVTFLYNRYVGRRGDTGAKILLLPTDSTAKNVSISWFDTDSKLEKYNVYKTQVDGTGNFVINHVATGEYLAIIVSKETSSEYWFEAGNSDDYEASVAEMFFNYMDKQSANEFASEIISYHKFTTKLITVYDNENTVFNYDFGITYI